VAEPTYAVAVPLARSPIPVAAPTDTVAGWVVSARRSTAALRLADVTPLAKVVVRAVPDGAAAAALAVPFGRAARESSGVLVIGSGPGEWTVLGTPGSAAELLAHAAQLPGQDGLVTAVDVTHGRALVRMTGASAAATLAKVCAVNLSDAATPNGAALRTSVAKLATDLIRDDDQDGARSYLLHCERSSGRYLAEALLDAGAEFGIEMDGYREDRCFG
jgi:heterotetrameric sarcosine oxidase gamma subunit